MKIFGLTVARTSSIEKQMQSVDTGRGWWPVIREAFTGAWQRNFIETYDHVLGYGPVFSCITLIASDVAKMRCRLVAQDTHGIWNEIENAAHSPVLRRPNHYQNRIQFFESWLISKLSRGNTYVLKARDARGVVVALYVLDPQRVRPLVAEGGDVYYELSKDPLSRQTAETVVVPAREIIHDRMNCLFHPLVGLSPIYAASLAASQGLRIQRNSAQFFANGARPSGILTAPGDISKETAGELKAYWETNFSGDNTAKIAVLGDGLKYEVMTMTSVDAELVAQLKMTAEHVCSVFHVPAYKVGAAAAPSYNNIEALDRAYYSQCLQVLIEAIELCLDEGLELKRPLGTEFDLDDLLRMDQASQIKTLAEGVKGGLMKPDEGRRKLNLPPVPGGNAVYLQQQNFSLEALAKRDAQDDPFAGPTPPAAGPPANDDEPPLDDDDKAALFESHARKAVGLPLLLTHSGVTG